MTAPAPRTPFPERPSGLAIITLLTALPYLINAVGSFARIAWGVPDYFITFLTPPFIAGAIAYGLAVAWRPPGSQHPGLVAAMVVLRGAVIVTVSLLVGCTVAHGLGIAYSLLTDPERTAEYLRLAEFHHHAEVVLNQFDALFLDGGWIILAAVLLARAMRIYVAPLRPRQPRLDPPSGDV